MTNLLNFDQSGLGQYFEGIGERPFRSTQLLQWIHKLGVNQFDSMTNLSKALREELSATAEIRPPEILATQRSNDGTIKWLLKVDAQNSVETVFIPEDGRGTLCISSQVGCPLDCKFCATAQQGFNRNLSTAEIIGQLWIAARELSHHPERNRVITNVVMMGMGEPLLNFDNVVRAMNIMLDDFAYSLAKRRVTLSTAGHVPGIDKLREACQVSLAVSLHAPNNALRDQIVPINKKYPIEQLLDACKRYAGINPHDMITFEYVMLDGVNDSLTHAKELITCLNDVPSKVNLIPFNPFPGTSYTCSSKDTINRFRDRLQNAGIVTVTRKTRGDDIAAACGQLVGEVKAKSARKSKLKVNHQNARRHELRI